MENEPVRLAIVVSEFNYDVTMMMLKKAISHARFLGATITYIVKVPGSFDMPLAIKNLLEKDDVDAIATLGAVIQGETKHDELVAHQVARKITDLSVEYGKPVTLGIIGPGATRMQAMERIEEYARRAVEAAVKMARRMRTLKQAKYVKETITIED